MDLEEKLRDKEIEQVADDEKQKDWNDLRYAEIYRSAFIDGAKWVRTKLTSICQQKIEDAITEYKSKLVEGQSSGEWQSILLINALRLLNDKERNELALSIIERTTPNLIDEAYKKQKLLCAEAFEHSEFEIWALFEHGAIIEDKKEIGEIIRTFVLNVPSPKESDNENN